MNEAPALVLRFGAAELDLRAATLTVGGEMVAVRAKTFALLAYLARNAGRVVGKGELMDVLWPNVTVTEDSLTQCVREARVALRDQRQAFLRTVSRRGYVLVPEASSSRTVDTGGSGKGAEPTKPAEPVLAVLPFRMDPGVDERLSPAALAEEIGHAIACFRSVAVIAYGSSARASSEADYDPASIGARLGAEFCVAGSVSVCNEIEVRVGLIETASRRTIWSDRACIPAAQVLSLPGRIAERVVSHLVRVVEANAARRAALQPAADPQAYAHLVRGIALVRSYGEGVNEAALDELRRAVALDPTSGLALAYAALTEVVVGGYHEAPRQVLDAALDQAMQAVRLSPEEPRCYRLLAAILMFRKELAAAETQYRRAMDLNPYDADTLMHFGYLRTIRGHPEEGLRHMAEGVRLNPLHPDWYHFDRHVALFLLGAYGESAEALERLPHRSQHKNARLAASHAMAGNPERAAKAMRDALTTDPGFDPVAYALGMDLERPSDVARYVEGMRTALAAMNE